MNQLFDAIDKSNASRRSNLIYNMESLMNQGLNCFSCTGECCTFISNSMKIDEIQAIDLLSFLKKEKRLTRETKLKLENCIKDYRLDQDLSVKKELDFRRTYTCPFYGEGSKGCSISRKSKPYGCLAFNALRPCQTDINGCHSDQDILKEREIQHRDLEEKLINSIPSKYRFNGTVAMPKALLRLWDLFLD